MPVRFRRRLVAVLLALGVLAGVGLLVAQRGGDPATTDAGHRTTAIDETVVADHALPAARRDDGTRRLALTLTLAALAVVAALAATTQRPTPVPVPVLVDDHRHRLAAGQQPRRRGPPPRA